MKFADKKNEKGSALLLACTGWATILSWLAVLPHGTVTEFCPIKMTFSMGHMIGYGILAALLCPYIRSKEQVRAFFHRVGIRNLFLISLTVTGIWGITTEFLQFLSFDRHPNVIDVALDMTGAVVGVAFYVILGHKVEREIQRRFFSTIQI